MQNFLIYIAVYCGVSGLTLFSWKWLHVNQPLAGRGAWVSHKCSLFTTICNILQAIVHCLPSHYSFNRLSNFEWESKSNLVTTLLKINILLQILLVGTCSSHEITLVGIQTLIHFLCAVSGFMVRLCSGQPLHINNLSSAWPCLVWVGGTLKDLIRK